MTTELDDLLLELVDECSEISKKPNGYWKNLDRCLKYARSIMKKHSWEKIPTGRDLRKCGYGGFAGAIAKYHGGLNKFRQDLGEKSFRQGNGYWRNIENCIEVAKDVIDEEGHLPPSRKLNELGYSSLAYAISKHHGGFPKFRELLDQPALQKPNHFWEGQENLFGEATTVIVKYGLDELPSSTRLNKLGHNDLVSAIVKFGGGFPVFRKKLAEYLSK